MLGTRWSIDGDTDSDQYDDDAMMMVVVIMMVMMMDASVLCFVCDGWLFLWRGMLPVGRVAVFLGAKCRHNVSFLFVTG